MNVVVNLGLLDDKGQFEHERWVVVSKWLAELCDNIRIYSKLSYKRIIDINLNGQGIEEEPFPDPAADMKGFRLWGRSNKLRHMIDKMYFDPEVGVTHCYFLDGDVYIGEIEVEDGENFLILRLTSEQENNLLEQFSDCVENVEICSIWHDHIQGLVGSERWKPLGQKQAARSSGVRP